MESLRSLAMELGVPERTLRRAAGEGLVHGERVTPRKFRTTLRERDYLRRQWPLLRRLRSLLRTEPNVSLAVLFGSEAEGTAGPRSDLDLLVELREDDVKRLADLSGRLSRTLRRDVQTVRLSDAQDSPALFADILAGGRVLVDREGTWPRLKAKETSVRRRAAREPSLEEVAANLDLGRRRR